MKFGLLIVSVLLLWQSLPTLAGDGEMDIKRIIAEHRYDLKLSDAGLAGPGGELLVKRAQEALFVLVGESHYKRQIAAFTEQLFSAIHSVGFNHMALENGRITARMLGQFAKQPDGMGAAKAFLQKYPESYPFYDCTEEFALLQKVAQMSDQAEPFWGLDQEFADAGRYLLNRLAGLAAAEENRAVLRDLAAMAEKKYREAQTYYQLTGVPLQGSGFLISISDEELARLQEAVAREKNSEMDEILFEWTKSHRIYTLKHGSHGERLAFFKTNFYRYFQAAERRLRQPPRVLIKMGNFHCYRGRGGLNAFDIGNFASELAAAYGHKSFHINMLSRNYASDGGKDLTDYDSRYGFLLDGADKNQAVVIDTASLRWKLNSKQRIIMGSELEKLLYGYDALVVLPLFETGSIIGQAKDQ